MRIRIRPAAIVLLLLFVVTLGLFRWVQHTSSGRAAYNVFEYRLRRLLPQRESLNRTGALAGQIRTADGAPLSDALALVATGRGEAFHATADSQGIYRIQGVTVGRYVPLAAKWGYAMQRYSGGTPIDVHAGRITTGIDFTLQARERYRPATTDLTLSEPVTVTGTFPRAITVTRRSVHIRHAGLTLPNAFLYEPRGTDSLPGLLLALPSPAAGWEPISVALANEGYVVLAVGPAAERRLDLDAHTRDLVAVAHLLFAGALTDRVDTARVGGLAGSFSSVLLFRALRDLPPLQAVVTMGGISDGFLGYQALFREDLQIPSPYDTFVASLGRPDRHPEIYLAASPAYFADHLPPTLIIHTHADRVIPVEQAVRFADALEQASTPYQLVLYDDVSHYLNPDNPTEETRRVYDVTIAFLEQWLE